jgi:hypothetical protein
MIIEMRTHKTKPGMRDRFIEVFRTLSIPKQEELGMKVLGPFPSIEDPDTLFIMRGFPDLAARETMKEQFYEGEFWKKELEGVLLPMLERWEVVVIEDQQDRFRW